MMTDKDEMREEYDFSRMSGGIRGKHAGQDISIVGATSHASPCPFCGASNVVIANDVERGYRIECQTCGAWGPPRSSEAEARESWDRREAA